MEEIRRWPKLFQENEKVLGLLQVDEPLRMPIFTGSQGIKIADQDAHAARRGKGKVFAPCQPPNGEVGQIRW